MVAFGRKTADRRSPAKSHQRQVRAVEGRHVATCSRPIRRPKLRIVLRFEAVVRHVHVVVTQLLDEPSANRYRLPRNRARCRA